MYRILIVRQPRGRDKNEVDCASLVTEHKMGRSSEDLSKRFKLSKSQVNRIIKKYRDDGTLGRKKGSGRKRKTTAAQDRLIMREVKKDRKVTGEEIRKSLDLENICDRTIRNRTRESGEFKSYWSTKKPFINETNRQKRVAWCREHENVPVEQWRTMLFSDESPFVLRFNKKLRVWRRHNERYNPECTVASVKHDKKIMVWGCFAAKGVGRLFKVEGIMEQVQYRKILDEQMLPSAEELFPEGGWMFQQDNDPKHTARMTKTWFEDNGVPLLPWPSQSPDLNPIENLWSILDNNLKDRRPQNEEQLFQDLKDGWERLPLDLLQRLADSMPRRIEAVIKAKGFATKY
jgi:DDE superfamily endonuclease/Transposase